MRKLYALFVIIVVFFPLAIAAMTLTSIRPWILDRSFYQGLVEDERLYESLVTSELPRQLNDQLFMPEEQLPSDALSFALGQVITREYAQVESVNAINAAFDYIEGRSRTLEVSFDVAPIKAALNGESRSRFAQALASALPHCAAGQTSIADGGSLTRCIATGESAETAAQQIAAALPVAIENMPDRVVFNNAIESRWYNWFRGASVRDTLDLALLMTILTAAGVGFIASFLGGDDLRGRLKWLSSSLFAPASLFAVMGLVLTSPYIASPISVSITASRYSQAFREAAVEVLIPVVQRIGSGFLITGVTVSVIALALLIYSWVTPGGSAQSGKIVQVPLRNAND